MNALHLLAAGMMICVVTASAWADDKKDKPDNAKMLVGKWEVTKTDKGGLEVGAVLEFSKDGKMKIIVKDGGKELSRDLVYKVERDKITMKVGDKEFTKIPFTIKKVSEQELVLEAGKGVAIELNRVK